MEGAKSLISSSFLYIISNFVNRLIPFLLLPLLTYYLSTAEMGVVSIFQSIAQFVIPVIGLGMAGIISIEYVRIDKEKIKQLVASSIGIICCTTLVLFFFAQGFLEELESFLSVESKFILLLPLLAFSMVVINIYTVLLQMARNVLVFSLVKISISIVELAITWALVVIMHDGGGGRIQAIIYTNVAACFFILLKLMVSGYMSYDIVFNKIKTMVGMGTPLIIYELCFLVVLLTDRLFIKHLEGIDSVGVYMVGMQLGMVIGLFESSIIRAWIPWFFTMLNNETTENKKIIVRYTYAYVSLLLLASIIWIGLSNWVVDYLIGSDYRACKAVIPWVSCAFLFMGLYKIAAQYLFFYKKTKLLMFISTIVASINIPITWWLVVKNGMLGAAQATLISYVIAFICTFFMAQKYYNMPFFRFST